jgi:hypothetical protein
VFLDDLGQGPAGEALGVKGLVEVVGFVTAHVEERRGRSGELGVVELAEKLVDFMVSRHEGPVAPAVVGEVIVGGELEDVVEMAEGLLEGDDLQVAGDGVLGEFPHFFCGERVVAGSNGGVLGAGESVLDVERELVVFMLCEEVSESL